MKTCIRIKILNIFLTGLFVCAAAGNAWAQAVVTDTTSTGKTIKQWFTEVKESKTVVGTMNTVKKTSSAIGTAKKSVSEYVIKNKEKLEKKLAKVKEYKEKAEKYKAEYDKYKKQLDENIAKAKELKAKAEAGIEQAKQMKDAAAGAIDAAKSKVDSVKDKVNSTVDAAKDKAGIKDETMAENTEGTDIEPSEGSGSASETGATTPATTNETTATGATANTSARQPFKNVSAPASSAQTENDLVAEKVLNTAELTSYKKLQSKQNLSATEKKQLKMFTSKIAAKQQELTIAPAVERMISIPEKTVAQPAVTKVQPAVKTLEPAQKTNLRKAFTTSSLQRQEPLAFAFALKLPDNGTDINGTVIIPEALALYCGLSSDAALKPGALDACFRKINKERSGAQAFSGSDAPKVYNRALAQYVAVSMAEAFKARQDADSFEENFIDKIDFAPELTAKDIYDNIVEMNKAVDIQMNGLLKVFSTQLAMQSMLNYNKYALMPAEEENE